MKQKKRLLDCKYIKHDDDEEKTGNWCRTFNRMWRQPKRWERDVLGASSTYNSYHVLSTLQTFSTRKSFFFIRLFFWSIGRSDVILAMCRDAESDEKQLLGQMRIMKDAYRVCFSIKSLVVRSQRRRATCNYLNFFFIFVIIVKRFVFFSLIQESTRETSMKIESCKVFNNVKSRNDRWHLDLFWNIIGNNHC